MGIARTSTTTCTHAAKSTLSRVYGRLDVRWGSIASRTKIFRIIRGLKQRSDVISRHGSSASKKLLDVRRRDCTTKVR